MHNHYLNTVPTIEAAIAGRCGVMGDTEGYAVAWPSSESCIGLLSDLDFNKQKSNAPNRM